MNRLWLLCSLAAADVLAALILHNGALIALALPLVVYIGSSLLAVPGKVTINVIETLEKPLVNAGEPVHAQLTFTNQGTALEELQVGIPINPGLERLEGPSTVLVRLAPGETFQTGFSFRGNRGKYEFPAFEVEAGDPFSLFKHRSSISRPGRLLILPSPDRLRRLPIRPKETRGFAGSIPARLGGSGTDFFDVREYQLGDPLRRVNWRISARQSRSLYTNDYELERTADIGLILDARQASDVTVNGDSLFEYAVQATASLARMFLKDGNRVGLLTYGFGLEWVFPGYGKVQQERIYRALARAETGHNYSLESLANLPVRLFPARSQIVIVSPLAQADAGALIRLRAHGYEILMVCPDPITFELKHSPTLDPQDPAVQLAKLERRLTLNLVKRSGIQLLDWDVEIPIERVLRSVLIPRINRLNVAEQNR